MNSFGLASNDLKQQIERILGWEQSSHWRLRDFETLGQLVFNHTRRPIDVHDLQRFWRSSDKIDRDFLDTLACFADYHDWADFRSRNSYGSVEVADDEVRVLHAPMWEIPMRWVVLICWLSVIASIVVAVSLVWKQ